MTQELLKQAFLALYPNKNMPKLSVKYSGRFSDYNGNVRMIKQLRTFLALEFSLSKKFVECEDELKIGIIQHLLNKVYKTKINTLEQDLYNSFLKHINKYAHRTENEPILEELYEELNKEYFNNMLDKPNMKFGQESTTTLGHYNYSKDLVTISTILKDDRELMKFVLYHELLHKKHQFSTKNGRSSYHTKEFREDEKKFHDKEIEKKLTTFVKKKLVTKALGIDKNKRMKKLLDWF